MSTAPPDEAHRRVPWGTLLIVLALGWFLLSRCDAPWGDDETGTRAGSTFAAEGALGEVLGERSRALQARDAASWSAVVGDAPEYAERQRWLFDNLAQLPLRVARWELVSGSARTESGDVVADVRRELQVDGWDTAPVVTVAAYRFRLTDTMEGERFRLVDDAESAAPWDQAPVQILIESGALVVAGSADARAAPLAGEVAAAIDAVSEAIPFAWNGHAMVYAVDDVALLAEVEGLRVSDPDQLDGVAFPVWTDPHGGGEVAALRVVLHPRVLDGQLGESHLDRLLRHELTHVALGDRDDRVPTWLAEGAAEYVAVRSLPRAERVISASALEAARRGGTTLPDDGAFRGPVSGISYGIAWFACEHIAATYGASALWSLLEAYAAAPDESRDSVLERTIGVDQAELAAAAAEQIVDTFG